jgi:hypothetical protein
LLTTSARSGKSPSEFYVLRCVLGVKCVGIFDEKVRVEQFVSVFVQRHIVDAKDKALHLTGEWAMIR